MVDLPVNVKCLAVCGHCGVFFLLGCVSCLLVKVVSDVICGDSIEVFGGYGWSDIFYSFFG